MHENAINRMLPILYVTGIKGATKVISSWERGNAAYFQPYDIPSGSDVLAQAFDPTVNLRLTSLSSFGTAPQTGSPLNFHILPHRVFSVTMDVETGPSTCLICEDLLLDLTFDDRLRRRCRVVLVVLMKCGMIRRFVVCRKWGVWVEVGVQGFCLRPWMDR